LNASPLLVGSHAFTSNDANLDKKKKNWPKPALHSLTFKELSKIRVFGDFGVQRAALVAPGICIHMCPV